jgi:hypothetical protein
MNASDGRASQLGESTQIWSARRIAVLEAAALTGSGIANQLAQSAAVRNGVVVPDVEELDADERVEVQAVSTFLASQARE